MSWSYIDICFFLQNVKSSPHNSIDYCFFLQNVCQEQQPPQQYRYLFLQNACREETQQQDWMCMSNVEEINMSPLPRFESLPPSYFIASNWHLTTQPSLTVRCRLLEIACYSGWVASVPVKGDVCLFPTNLTFQSEFIGRRVEQSPQRRNGWYSPRTK